MDGHLPRFSNWLSEGKYPIRVKTHPTVAVMLVAIRMFLMLTVRTRSSIRSGKAMRRNPMVRFDHPTRVTRTRQSRRQRLWCWRMVRPDMKRMEPLRKMSGGVLVVHICAFRDSVSETAIRLGPIKRAKRWEGG